MNSHTGTCIISKKNIIHQILVQGIGRNMDDWHFDDFGRIDSPDNWGKSDKSWDYTIAAPYQ